MPRRRTSSEHPGCKSTAGRPAAANRAGENAKTAAAQPPAGRPSALLDTRVIYCGDCLDQLQKLPDGCVDLIYIDPPFNPGRARRREATPRGRRPRRVSRVNSNRNYEVFWGETKETRTFEDRHASTAAYID